MSDDRMDVDEDLAGDPGSALNRAAQEKELDDKFPNRPRNHSPTLPFHSLFQDLFDPLNDTKKKQSGPATSRRKTGPNVQSQNPQERRRALIERFISRWRRQVGDDIYPAFRLIIPEKDRDRAMYGLKEKVLGKLLVKIMQIDKNSEDGFSLLNWKLPGNTAASRMAGEFPGRCYEVLSKRPFRVEVGDMTIGEVNDQLDKLAATAKEENQLPILTDFYQRMNAEELMWLIRVILRQMKVGATEKTFFHLWHPDAESLFNVSSSLRRVCWELYNPSIRLEGEDRGVALMQCFQPQLAQFQMHDFKKIVEKMKPTEDDDEFWVEEKLDGERMQLHMVSDDSVPGGKAFKFWSRKAKDYTYLYGASLFDKSSALTQHIRDGFHDGVENIILDGEMITWDPEQDRPCAFGTLKTAALSEQKNPFAGKERPLFRVFDILLLNDQPLTQYVLRDRRKALEASVKPVHRRLEIHDYKSGTQPEDIELALRDIITRASEGLVIKSPRSSYRLNDRNDDWMKVKPEYMMEFGENLDCLIIGGYYGSGRRGGGLSSFLCGLRADESPSSTSYNPQKFRSFFKVGGGLTANDYANIRHITDGKWIDWDSKKPPLDYIELAGGATLQREKPDVWIKPPDSVVIEAKAAQVSASDEFACGLTLRFPRFKRVRQDKSWEDALSVQEFLDLKNNAEAEHQQKKLEVDESRKKRRKLAGSRKQPMAVMGYTTKEITSSLAKSENAARTAGKVFANLTFYIMTDANQPTKRTKLQLEELVKLHGGAIVQTHTLSPPPLCIAERRTVKVASLQKLGSSLVIKPMWLFDCIAQAEADTARSLPPRVVPFETERHLFFIPVDQADMHERNIDEFGDAFARDTTVDELREVMSKMKTESKIDKRTRERLLDPGKGILINNEAVKGWVFQGTKLFFPPTNTTSGGVRLAQTRTTSLFAGASLAADIDDKSTTHIVIENTEVAAEMRTKLSTRKKMPRLVTPEWIEESWAEGTLLDEEGFTPA